MVVADNELTCNRVARNILRCQPRNKFKCSARAMKLARTGIRMADWYDDSLLVSSLKVYKSLVRLILLSLKIEAGSLADQGSWKTWENHYEGHYDAIKYTLPNKSSIYVWCNDVGNRHRYDVVIYNSLYYKLYRVKGLNYVDLRKYLDYFIIIK